MGPWLYEVKKNKTSIFFWVSFLVIWLMPYEGFSQTTQDSSAEETQEDFLTGFPFIFYLPETRWGFGGASVYTFLAEKDTANRISNLQLGGAYTQNKQLLTYFSYNIFFNRDRSLLRGELGYYDYFYPYYGIGPDSDLEVEEIYPVRFPRVKINYLQRFFSQWYLGVNYNFDDYAIHGLDSSGLLSSEQPIGYDGSIVSGLGLSAIFDRRDVQFYPSDGLFLVAQCSYYNQLLGSSSNFVKCSLSVSGYEMIVRSMDLILAWNVQLQYSGENAPFQELSLYGGHKYARGYVNGRFRDQSLGIGQVELRFPLFWRFGGVAFASVGGVNKSLHQVFEYPKWNVGAGLRFTLSQKDLLNMRLDFGLSEEGNAFYLTVEEAF